MLTLNRLGLRCAALVLPHVRSNLAADDGDVFRDRRDWDRAAAQYRRALAIRPKRRSIWIQLGHALKEAGRFDEALAAYRRASALPGSDGDAPLHHGIMAKRLGLMVEAKAALLQSVRENIAHPRLSAEMLALLHDPLAISAVAAETATRLAADEAARLAASAHHSPAMVFDVSDLIAYFRHSRLPTGIQRVQLEVIRGALAARPSTQICFFSDQGDDGIADGWTRIPAALFLTLADLAVSAADLFEPAWTEAIEALTAMLRHGAPVAFTPGAFLINLGTSWWLQNYFLHVREAQRRFRVRYVPFVHDFIPIMTPEHCITDLTEDFISWVLGVFDHATFFLTNSQSTSTDLTRVAAMLGRTVPPETIAMVPLNADFRRAGEQPLPAGDLGTWGLQPGHFALFVATIESRKNHIQAFRAWRVLIDRHGADAVPDLVCVGNRGWLNDHVHAALDADPLLKSKVRMLSHLTDAQLALLYRECLCTVYPSLYEGWGLPVTESLCHGKVPVLTRTSSLSEAGGDFAVYVEPGDVEGLADALGALQFTPDYRTTLEANIRANFVPRSWYDLACQISADLDEFMHRVPAAMPPQPRSIALDTHYRFRRNRRTRLVATRTDGEALRLGTGWWQGEDWGCSTKPEGGTLAFCLPEGIGTVRCWLRLRGPDGLASDASITTGAREWRFALPEARWLWVSLPAQAHDNAIRLHIHGDVTVDLSRASGFQDRRRIGPGLGSLIVTRDPHTHSRKALAKALAVAASSTFAFIEAVYPLLCGQDADAATFMDFLAPLESGAMSRLAMIEELINTPEADQVVQFEA